MTTRFDEQNDLYNRIATTLGKPYTHEYIETPLRRYWGLMFCGLPCLGKMNIESNSTSFTKSFQDRVAKLGREDPGLAIEFHEWLQTGSHKDYKYYERFVQRLSADVTPDQANGNRFANCVRSETPTLQVAGKLGIRLSAGQQEAIRQACQHKFLAITGGPGVGKTTLVRGILEIFQGRMSNLKTPEGLGDFDFIEVSEPEAIQDVIVKLVKERIPTRFGFDSKTDIQVLSPMNQSLLGARNLNQVLQQALNPGDGGPEVQRFGQNYRIGDRVIQTENDYNRDVLNGDLDVIEKINRIEPEMVVNFEGRLVDYDFGDLDELSLAYVLSIHKRQAAGDSGRHEESFGLDGESAGYKQELHGLAKAI